MTTVAPLPKGFHLAERPVRNRRRYNEHQSSVRSGQGGLFTSSQALPPTTALGARLRELRTTLGLNQADMAVRLGYARNNNGRVSDHELGHVTPSLGVLYRYAQVFGITVSDLLAGVL